MCQHCRQLGYEHGKAVRQAVSDRTALDEVHRKILAHRADFLKARDQMNERMLEAARKPHEVLYLGLDYTGDIDLPARRPATHNEKGPLAVKIGGLINFSTQVLEIRTCSFQP